VRGVVAIACVKLARAFVRELRIQVPWTALASQPAVLALDSVELSFVSVRSGQKQQRGFGESGVLCACSGNVAGCGWWRR
jgi:hypothetical protein